MSLFHLLRLKIGPQKLQSVIVLYNLYKFHLELCIPRYINSPQVSCLGMNPGRSWNPNLEGSYIPEYSESEAEFWTQCTERFYLQPLKFLAPDPF